MIGNVSTTTKKCNKHTSDLINLKERGITSSLKIPVKPTREHSAKQKYT